MGSMDSSRIGQFLGLTSKMVGPAESAGTNDKGGFADLLFGVMSKRVSTVKTGPDVSGAGTLPGNRVSTVLPLGEPVATHVSRPDAARAATPTGAGSVGKARAAETVPPTGDSRPGAGAKPAVDKPAADKNVSGKAKADAPAETGIPNGDVAEAASTSEGAEIGEEGGEDRDLSTDAETGDGGNGDLGQEDATGQQLDPQAAAIVIEALTLPAEGAETVAVIGISALAELADDGSAPAALPPAQPALTSGDAKAAALPATPALSGATPTGSTPSGQQQMAPEAEAQPDNQAADTAEAAPAAKPATADPAAAAALALTEDLLGNEAEAQAALLARQNERRSEDAVGIFRRNTPTPRQRAAAAGTGTTGMPAQPAASSAPKVATPLGTPPAATTPAATTILPLAPMGFDTGLGPIPGMPGWTLNLAQGNAARRPELLANLRQHLQNLPAHEQMALGIQRSARDGGGRITLQLSPSELGRIHLKLDIDEEKNVRASVSVERPATLELLQRDSKALERALQDAGLKMDQNDLSFSLHGGDSDSFAREFGAEGRDLADLLTEGSEDEAAAEVPAPTAVISTGDGMVDVQI